MNSCPPPREGSGSGRTSTDIDKYVGARVRERRSKLGMSQERLSELIGVSFQQLQKYEGGINRIGASRLYMISVVLDAPVSYFFGAGDNNEGCIELAESEGTTPLSDALLDKDVMSAVDTFARIDDHYLRSKLVDMLEAFAEKAIRDKRRKSAKL